MKASDVGLREQLLISQISSLQEHIKKKSQEDEIKRIESKRQCDREVAAARDQAEKLKVQSE